MELNKSLNKIEPKHSTEQESDGKHSSKSSEGEYKPVSHPKGCLDIDDENVIS